MACMLEWNKSARAGFLLLVSFFLRCSLNSWDERAKPEVVPGYGGYEVHEGFIEEGTANTMVGQETMRRAQCL